MGVIFWLAADSGQNSAVPMAHLLDRLLRRPSVKDEGLARNIDDVMAKPQLVFRVDLSSYSYVCKNEYVVCAMLGGRAYYLFFRAVLDSRAPVCC